MLGTEIDDDVANVIVAQLLFLESEDPDKDINLYINSPGGSVTAGLAIYDTMQYVKPAGLDHLHRPGGLDGRGAAARRRQGQAARAAQRADHDPPAAGRRAGQATDIEIQAKEILRLKSRLNEIIAKHTGQPIERVEKDTDRDYFMGASEAKEYGLIDEVVLRRTASASKTAEEAARSLNVSARRPPWRMHASEALAVADAGRTDSAVEGGDGRQERGEAPTRPCAAPSAASRRRK